MALRVCSMGLPQRGQSFPRLAQRLADPARSRPAGNIMAGQDSVELELIEDIRTKRRAELAQLLEREILQLAALGNALLHGTGDDLMGFTEGHTAMCQIRGRCESIHKASLAGGAHAFVVELNLAHEAVGDSHAMGGGHGSLK